MGPQARRQAIPPFPPSIVHHGKIAPARHSPPLVDSPINHCGDVCHRSSRRALLQKGVGSFKIDPRTPTGLQGLVVDLGPNPAGPDDKDIQIGHLIIQKLAHLNECNFSETIGRIPRKRTIRATPCKKNHMGSRPALAKRKGGMQGTQLGRGVDLKGASPIVELDLRERAHRIQDANAGDPEIPDKFAVLQKLADVRARV